LSYNNVMSVYQDRKGDIWVGTEYGLNRFDQKERTFERYFTNSDDPGSLSHSTVKAITEDLSGNLVIGTLGGLNQLDKKNGRFIHFPVNQNTDYCLNNEFINSLFSDKDGNVWIGTDKGGVNSYNIYQKQFGYFVHNPASTNSLSYNTVNSVFEEQSALWVGTAGGGLNKYDRLKGAFKVYRTDPHYLNGLSSDFVTYIQRDKKKNLWIGTWGGGLDRMVSDNGKGVFKRYRHQLDDPGSICSDFISSVLEDNDQALLVCTLSGLDVFDIKKEQFRHIASLASSKYIIREVGCILKDKRDNYWVGTRTALYRLQKNKNGAGFDEANIQRFVHDPNDPNSLPGNYIAFLCEDKLGSIWIGTYGDGISQMKLDNSNNATFKNYSETKGLANNAVYTILEDGHGNLWFSTDNGLSRFDTKNEVFHNFYISDGLQSNQFYWGAAFKSQNGMMYFGGMKGLNFFFPDSIHYNPNLPKVVITDLKIFNNSVSIGTPTNRRIILDKVISETTKIKLSYKDNVFSFEFSALDYFLPDKTKYAYKMVGVDKDWVYVPSSRRFANYTNLKGGEYTFLVKACNSDLKWNNEPTRLNIIIAPPFYSTIWFKMGSIMFLFFMFLGYLGYRTRTLELHKKRLEKQVRERTAKIEEQKKLLEEQADHLIYTNQQLAKRRVLIEGQKEQLELQNKEISEQRDKMVELNKRVQMANQLKLRFFTNISHEFRTPLTLILGPLEKLVASWKGDEEVKNTLVLINRNAQRLLHLINQLMEFRKIETGKMELKVSQGNLVEFLENIYNSFDLLAAQHQIRHSFVVSPGLEQTAWFDCEKVENIVYNLLSNAFKYTPDYGEVILSVSQVDKRENSPVAGEEKFPKYHGCYTEINVTDTGIGIPSEHLNDIFKRFYRATTPESLKIRGSGIGLSLTRELVKAHHGHIMVVSEVGKGSSFTVLLPVQKENFQPSEIIDEPRLSSANIKTQVEILTEELGRSRHVNVEANSVHVSHDIRPLVLIVEDNFDLRTFIANSLYDEYKVLEAGDGKEAYELAKGQSPDLIISDIMMPEMDGLELCSKIKNNLVTSHIPVILLTARSSVENWIEGLETGADDYMPKPFNINILIARIKNIIEIRKNLRKIFSKELTPDPSKFVCSSPDEEFIKKAMEVVGQNFTNPEFGVDEFVNKMNVSRSLLHKKLSSLTDQSAGDFINALRMKKAAGLILLNHLSISEIAFEVGFNDPKYFSRSFKKYFGITPSDYFTQNAVKIS
jgi:signal transduction histidine kinase/CheY-like chemotaxis protein/AraC-like DNA-binding protein/streptogramin lyase